MRLRQLLLAAASTAALSACSASSIGGPDDGPGPGGKADDARACAAGVNCLQFASYEVLFTNPLCGQYSHDDGDNITDLEGDPVIGKPKNVYCRDENDRKLNFDGETGEGRVTSPLFRIVDWISDTNDGDEIFLSYLSFSDDDVFNALCDASGRGVDITFIVDKKDSGDHGSRLEDCGATVLERGGGKVPFAHVKLMMINPDKAGPDGNDEKFLRMTFGSGNMSTGTYLHHENWHFLEVARESYFVEAHKCLRDSLIAHDHTSNGDGKGEFADRMDECTDRITTDLGLEEEDDMKAYFVPALSSRKKQQKLMRALIAASPELDMGVHRIGSKTIIDPLSSRLEDDSDPVRLRLIADDDLFWRNPVAPAQFKEEGFNGPGDVNAIQDLEEADTDSQGNRRGRFEQKFMETATRQFHHNKYIIFNDIGDLQAAIDTDSDQSTDVSLAPATEAVMMGAANITGTGFNDNFENNYITTIPEVVDAFQAQFTLLWDGEGQLPEGHDVAPRATAIEDMPRELVHITEPDEPVPGGNGDCGLRIVEFMPNPDGTDGGREWIKLYNSCDDDQSLDGLSLGWGGSEYSSSASFDLSGIDALEGKSCMIIGAQTSDSGNGSPDVDVKATFSPGLQNGGDVADAVALFAAAASDLSSSSIPLDAVIYGGADNGNGLVDGNGDARAPHNTTKARAGDSYRLDNGVWTHGDPKPADCPSF